MTVRLRGGSALRARIENVAQVGPDFAQEWADETVKRIRATKPPSRRPASSRFSTKVKGLRAGVYGAFWWIFVDRGTKAHVIDAEANPKKNPPTHLKFSRGGRTIFAKKVHHPRTRRRPFISRAAQDALTGSRFAESVIRRWNGLRIKGPHERFL